VDMLINRTKLARYSEHRDAMARLAVTVQTGPRHALHPDALVKLASVVDTFDRANGLSGKYTKTIPRPEDVLFEATYKEARAGLAVACPMTSGKVYDMADFVRIKLATVQALFGTEMVNEVRDGIDGINVEKLAELARTLPQPDAELFDRLAAESGVHPIQSKMADDISLAMEQEVQEVLAADYGA
jgi:hypothetical protein